MLLVVGINWRTSPIEIREQVAFSNTIIPETLRTLRRFSGVFEVMIVSTCNRVELYASADDNKTAAAYFKDFLASFHDRDDARFDQYCYVREEMDAVRHIFRVAAGLDSMVMGENEILHQVKEAYKLASREGTVGGVLAMLVEQAIKVGREVRHKTKIGDGAVGVAAVACELAQKIFGKLTDQRVLILGTGKIGSQTLRNLTRTGVGELIVAVRDPAMGQQFVRQFGATVVDFSEWLRYLADTDIVIASTSAPHYIIRFQDVKRFLEMRHHKPLFMIDIAVPRNIDPEVNKLGDVYLYDIDDLKDVAESNLKLRRKEIGACEEIIQRRTEQFFVTLDKLKAGPTIEALNKRFDDIVAEEWAEIGKRLSATPEQAEEVHAFVSRIKGKFLHHPMSKLKEAAEDGGIFRYTETIRRLFELDASESDSNKR